MSDYTEADLARAREWLDGQSPLPRDEHHRNLARLIASVRAEERAWLSVEESPPPAETLVITKSEKGDMDIDSHRDGEWRFAIDRDPVKFWHPLPRI